ncbi:hypothetical protein FRC09_005816 [Ceratobasidium sp. 395]|nr:hypothetical protein FRC09_005816 [Ceratobasidium sp. 395]
MTDGLHSASSVCAPSPGPADRQLPPLNVANLLAGYPGAVPQQSSQPVPLSSGPTHTDSQASLSYPHGWVHRPDWIRHPATTQAPSIILNTTSSSEPAPPSTPDALSVSGAAGNPKINPTVSPTTTSSYQPHVLIPASMPAWAPSAHTPNPAVRDATMQPRSPPPVASTKGLTLGRVLDVAQGSPLTPSSTPIRTSIHIALQLYRYLQRFDPFYSLELENDLNYYRNLSEVQEVELEVLLEWQQEALQTFQRDQQIILELEELIHE